MALRFDLGMAKNWTDKSVNESAGTNKNTHHMNSCSGANRNIKVIFLQGSPIIQLSEIGVLLF